MAENFTPALVVVSFSLFMAQYRLSKIDKLKPPLLHAVASTLIVLLIAGLAQLAVRSL